MKSYNLETTITFGKFEGKTIAELLDIQPSYINWCIVNLDHFFMDNETITAIKKQTPQFVLSTEAAKIQIEKNRKWILKQISKNSRRDYFDDHNYNSNSTYENYSGSYAQEIEGYSDQDIDDIFDGDPSAYWNID